MAEPIKCPFCGRTPIVEDCGTNRWFVRCKCGIAQDKLYHQRCDAVRAWNRRKSIQPDFTDTNVGDTIYRQAAIAAMNRHLDTIRVVNNNTVEMIRRSEVMDCREIINGLPSAEVETQMSLPDESKYEYHYDHTDCIWYRPEARNRCPVTCAQYRDGWNDAMNYIFRDGKGYRPYRRDEQYGE